MKPLILVACCVSLAACVRTSSPKASGSDPGLPFDGAVLHGTLDNGLTWYIRPNAKPAEQVELRLIVEVGSLVENDDQRGLAHVVEHMAFNGTERFPGGTLVSTLERLGMSFGAHLNASTGFDATQYLLTVPTDDPENLDLGLSVLGEWAGRIQFDPAEVDAERGVVQSEWRRWRGASQRLSEQVLGVTRSERHAARIPIGTEAVLASFTDADLRTFYETWYTPERMSVIVVGDVEPGYAEQLIQKHLGSLPKAKRQRDTPSYPSRPPQHSRVTLLSDPETTGSAATITWKHTHNWAHTQQTYRAQLARGLFLSMANDRLADDARQPNTGVLSAVAAVVALERGTAAVSISVEGRGAEVSAPLRAALTTIRSLAVHGPGEQALERAKSSQLRSVDTIQAEYNRTPSTSLAEELSRHVLLDETVPGIRLEHTLHHRFMPVISAEEVRAAGAALFDLSRPYDVIVSLPADAPAPDTEQLLASIAQIGRETPENVSDRAAEELDYTPPAPGEITSETFDEVLGITHWTLTNGVQVLIKSTDFQNEQVLIAAYSPGGHSLAPDETYIPAYVADELAFRSGLAGMNDVALRESLAGRSVQIRPFISGEFEGFQGGFAPREANTALTLAHLFLTQPAFDAAVQARMQANLAERIAQSIRSPDVAFANAVNDAMWQDHRRRREWRVTDLEQFDLAQSEAFYRERFADLNDLVVFIVGSISADDLREPVQQWLGSFPASDRQESWRHTGDVSPDGPVKREVRRGVDPDRALVTVIWHGPMPKSTGAQHGPEEAFRLGVAADIFSTRLRERLREELGATYDVSAGASTELVPVPRYRLAVELSCAPSDVERLTGEIHAALRTLRTTAPSTEELSTVQTRYRRSRDQSMRTNSWWLDTLASATMYPGRSRDDILAFAKVLDGLTPDAITKTVARVVDADRFVQVALLPEDVQ